MKDAVIEEEALPGVFLVASEWQGPNLAGPTALSRELWVLDGGVEEPPETSRARAAARAEARSDRLAEEHPERLARPMDPWCLME